MNFNKILQSLFGNKSTRDMKLIQPIVEKIKAEYPKMQALSNDELRAKTKELQKYVQEYAKEEKAKIAELKAKIEDTPIDEHVYDVHRAVQHLQRRGLPAGGSVAAGLHLHRAGAAPLAQAAQVHLHQLPRHDLFYGGHYPRPHVRGRQRLVHHAFHGLDALPPFP